MALKRQPIQIVEIDIDFCTLTYGTGACTAVLGTSGVRKCYNTWNTCQARSAYDKGTLTLRFVTPRSNLPIGPNVYFPVLKSVSAFSSSVNISGNNPKMGQLGRRGKVTVAIDDFPYHDRVTDKYAVERRDGTAQTDEGGYNPEDRGTFWTKFKKRTPNYAGRPLRVINTYILENGTIDTSGDSQTRNFIITELKGPDDNNSVTIEAKDILTLAEKKTAVAPTPSEGSLLEDIDENDLSFVLEPTGIGSDYPTSGFGVIGSEIIQYTRSGDTVTIIARGVDGTEVSSHSSGDTFQEAVKYENQFIYQVLDDLLGNYTNIDSAFIDSANYQSEVERWAPTTKINTTITEPTPVADLLGELAVLGASIWWDDVAQKIKLRMNHPLDLTEEATSLSDDNAIKGIRQEDRDEDRITQVHFYSVQSNPTEGLKDKSNYDRVLVSIDTDAQRAENYGEPRIREIFCRWLNTGNDPIVRIISQRILDRFNAAPEYFHLTLDAKDISLGLTDILSVTSRVISDETGKSVPKQLQITEKSETKSGHEVKIVCQSYEFDDFYGFIMENDANGFDSATDLEKEEGAYIIAEADVDDGFADGTQTYRMI